MAFNVADLPLVPILISTFLAGHGLRKRSPSPSGAFSAFFIEVTMLSPPLQSFGISLIIFYLVRSRVTKVGKSRKAQLEGRQEAGYRDASQAFCNSFPLSWPPSFGPPLSFRMLVVPRRPYDSAEWCPVSPQVISGWNKALLLVALGCVQGSHFDEILMEGVQPLFLLFRRYFGIQTGHIIHVIAHLDYLIQTCSPWYH